jgi:hypothetical protein
MLKTMINNTSSNYYRKPLQQDTINNKKKRVIKSTKENDNKDGKIKVLKDA